MIHQARAYRVTEVGSAEELTDKLALDAWSLCTAFRLGNYLFLNDSAHEDGFQRFAVLKCPATTGDRYLQVESACFSQGTAAQALRYIGRILAGRFDRRGTIVRHQIYLETASEHELCHHCG